MLNVNSYAANYVHHIPRSACKIFGKKIDLIKKIIMNSDAEKYEERFESPCLLCCKQRR